MRHSWIYLLALLVFGSGTVAAQVAGSSAADQEAATQTDPQQVLADTDQEPADEDDDVDLEEDEDAPSRFIPTEQISQDLGVSFPADI